jgi:hypothetical protein
MNTQAIKLFETKKVRTVWNENEEEWYFSIVDVIGILTDSPNPRKYWSVLKTILKQEGSELTTNCTQLKLLAADGKNYLKYRATFPFNSVYSFAEGRVLSIRKELVCKMQKMCYKLKIKNKIVYLQNIK